MILAERCGRELSGHAGFLQTRVRCYEANLVDTNALRASKGGFQLIGQLGWFGFSSGKCAYKSSDFFLSDGGEKLNAGQPGGGEELGELFFSWSALKRNTVEEQLRTGGAEH
jgi:hypothetical protein